jgi:hypothetical protein
MSIVREVLSGVDLESMLLGIAFVIILAVLMVIFGRIRIFQKNQGIKTIVAICVSLLSIYGISKSSFDLENLFYSIGFGEEIIYNLILLAIVAFFIITMIVRDEITGRIKFRLYRSMILLGIIFIALRFTPWAHGDGSLFIGIPLLVIGLILWNRRRRATDSYFKGRSMNPKEYLDYKYKLKKNNKLEKQQEQEQRQEERAKREQRLRSQRELQGKYNEYSRAIQKIQRKNNGRIPELGTQDGNLRHRYIQAMQAIEQLARNQGFGLS